MTIDNKEYINQDKSDIPKDEYLYLESVKKDVELLINEETCPNCGSSMFGGKCENYDWCWYWHWDDFEWILCEDLIIKNEKIDWNWKKYELTTIWWEKFYFYNYFWRIENNKANIQIKIWEKLLKINLSYEILENDEIKTIWNIKILSKVKIKQKNWKWKDCFVYYRDLKKYIISVLSDTRFNNYL